MTKIVFDTTTNIMSQVNEIFDNDLLNLCVQNKYNTDKYYTGRTHLIYPSSPNFYGHVYVEEVYGKYFKNRKDTTLNVLEIGIDNGGSLLLWQDYFYNAIIHGTDIRHCHVVDGQPRIVQYTMDAYANASKFEDGFFDIMIDDGPHTLESMVLFIKNYSSKLKPGGIMVIEDIPKLEWKDTLFSALPHELLKYAKVHDMRSMKNNFDDIVFVVDTGEVNG